MKTNENQTVKQNILGVINATITAINSIHKANCCMSINVRKSSIKKALLALLANRPASMNVAHVYFDLKNYSWSLFIDNNRYDDFVQINHTFTNLLSVMRDVDSLNDIVDDCIKSQHAMIDMNHRAVFNFFEDDIFFSFSSVLLNTGKNNVVITNHDINDESVNMYNNYVFVDTDAPVNDVPVVEKPMRKYKKRAPKINVAASDDSISNLNSDSTPKSKTKRKYTRKNIDDALQNMENIADDVAKISNNKEDFNLMNLEDTTININNANVGDVFYLNTDIAAQHFIDDAKVEIDMNKEFKSIDTNNQHDVNDILDNFNTCKQINKADDVAASEPKPKRKYNKKKNIVANERNYTLHQKLTPISFNEKLAMLDNVKNPDIDILMKLTSPQNQDEIDAVLDFYTKQKE